MREVPPWRNVYAVSALVLMSTLAGPSGALGNTKQSDRPHAPSKRDRASQPKFKPGQVLVRFRPGVSRQATEAAHAVVVGRTAKTWSIVEGLQLVHLPSGGSVGEALQAYRQNPNI